MFMSGKDYRESLRAYKPSVYVNGRKVKSVAGDADLAERRAQEPRNHA